MKKSNTIIPISGIEEVVELVYEHVSDLESYDLISIVAKFDEAVDIIRELLRYDDVEITDISIMRPDYNNYYDEYVIQVGSDFELSCCPMLHNGDYLNCYDDYFTIVFSHCSDDAIGKCSKRGTYIVEIGDDYECDGNCDECGVYCHDHDECEENEKELSYEDCEKIRDFVRSLLF